jgi:hypothetical protein
VSRLCFFSTGYGSGFLSPKTGGSGFSAASKKTVNCQLRQIIESQEKRGLIDSWQLCTWHVSKQL